MKKGLFFAVALFFIGCNETDDANNAIQITTLSNNIWIGKTCYASGIYDQNGNLHNTYHKSTYEFKENKVMEKIENFSDINCTSSLNTYSDYNLSYYDLGLKESIHGYDVYDIKIEERTKEQNAFYVISANELCFSKSIYSFNVEELWTDLNGNEYTSQASGLHIFTTRDNSIDYENCLIKK